MVRSTQSRKVSKKTSKRRTSRKIKGGNSLQLEKQTAIIGGSRRKISKNKGNASRLKEPNGSGHKMSKRKKQSGGAKNTIKRSSKSKKLRNNQLGGAEFQEVMDKILNNQSRKVADFITAYDSISLDDMKRYVNCPELSSIKNSMSINISNLSQIYKSANSDKRKDIIYYLGRQDRAEAQDLAAKHKFPYINNILSTRNLLALAMVNTHGT